VPWPERENVPGQRPQASRGTDGAYGAETAQGGSGAGGATAAEDAREERRAGGAREAGGNGDTGGNGDRRGVEGIRGFDDEGVRGAFGTDGRPGTLGGDGRPGTLGGDGRPETYEPDVIQAARRDRRTLAHGSGGHGTRARRVRARKAPPRPAPEDDEEHYIPPTPPPLPKLDPITKGAWVALFGGPAYLVIATAVDWSVPGIAAFFAVAAFVTGFAVLVLRMNEPGPGGPDGGDDGARI
jgi:hypothetical protein